LKNCKQQKKFESIKNIVVTVVAEIYVSNYVKDAQVNPNYVKDTQATPNYLKGTQVTPNYLKSTQVTPKLNNGLPLVISIKNKSCTKNSSTFVKTSDTKSPKLWRDIEGTIVLKFQEPKPQFGRYLVTVNDTGLLQNVLLTNNLK